MSEVRRSVDPAERFDGSVFHYSIPRIQATGDGELEPASEIGSTKLQVTGPTLLVSKLNPRKGVVLEARVRDDAPTVCSSEFVCLLPKNCHLRFASYLFQSEQIRQHLDGMVKSATRSHQRIQPSDITKLWLRWPPLPTQRAIAAFLDRETAKIDALVEKKRRLLDLLDEKRRSYMEQIVRTRLENREVKLGHVVDILAGYAFPSTGFSREESDSVRLLRGVNVAPGAIDWADCVYWPAEEAGEFSRYQLSRDDIVLGMDRPWISKGIRVARISQAHLPALLLQRVARLRANPSFLLQDYLQLVLSSPQFQAYFEPILTGVSVPHISPAQIGGFRFPLPSIEDQHAQITEFRLSQRHAEGLTAALRRSVRLLTEYRTALISAAVTGQIDVTEAAA